MAGIAQIFARLAGRFRRDSRDDQWLAPGNSVTRAIDSGRDLARLEPGHVSATRHEPLARPATPDLLARIEAALAEPIVAAEAPRIIITDDAAPPMTVPGNPAVEAGVLRPRQEKKSRRRWWRAA